MVRKALERERQMRLLEAPVIAQLPSSVLRRLGQRVPARLPITQTRARQLQQRVLLDLTGCGQPHSFGPFMNVAQAYHVYHIERCNVRQIAWMAGCGTVDENTG